MHGTAEVRGKRNATCSRNGYGKGGGINRPPAKRVCELDRWSPKAGFAEGKAKERAGGRKSDPRTEKSEGRAHTKTQNHAEAESDAKGKPHRARTHGQHAEQRRTHAPTRHRRRKKNNHRTLIAGLCAGAEPESAIPFTNVIVSSVSLTSFCSTPLDLYAMSSSCLASLLLAL